jgi:4-amino-4-deoxy-L-arabinose transferase-like glycosyltransferase
VSDRSWALAIAGVAVLVRVPAMVVHHEPASGGDSQFYLDAASSIASGDGFPSYFWAPGYSAFIALLSILPGPEEDIVTVVQHLLGAGMAVLVFFATRRWFGLLAAVMAAGLAALGPVMVFHEHLLLPDFLFGLLVFLGALLLAEACADEGRPVRLLIAAGLLFGLATWVKPAGQFLVFAAPLPLLLASRDWRRALRGSAVVAGVLVLAVSPWLVRNATQRDIYGMSIQSGSTLFNRAFEVSTLPIPPGEEHGALAEQVRTEVAGKEDELRFHVAFHRALQDEAGLSGDDAIREQQSMAVHAIWTYPKAYTIDSITLLNDTLEDITRFEGRYTIEHELEDSAFPEAATTALLDAAHAIIEVWWILCAHGFAALLVLFVGDRRSRMAGAALLSVWLAVALGTVFTHGGLWRYSMQLAPITLMLASAGAAILVTSVRDFRRRGGSPA